ncbi:hypothetical protein ACFLV7_01960 [Chloroflexota bacterium]
MKTDIPKLMVSTPATYKICVQGHWDEKWSDYVQGMSISTEYDECQNLVTTLTGQLLDQAAFMGVINALYDYRLPILSVECLSAEIGAATTMEDVAEALSDADDETEE